jgi:hypothetical protein
MAGLMRFYFKPICLFTRKNLRFLTSISCYPTLMTLPTISATMLLHRGRSSLAYTSLSHTTNQSSNSGSSDFLLPSNLDFHTGKTLCAADMMAKLVTIPRPMITHSPLFNCCLALSCVIHLTAWPPLLMTAATAESILAM